MLQAGPGRGATEPFGDTRPGEPPSWDFHNCQRKKLSPPPLPAPWTPPSLPPSRKIKNIRNVHQATNFSTINIAHSKFDCYAISLAKVGWCPSTVDDLLDRTRNPSEPYSDKEIPFRGTSRSFEVLGLTMLVGLPSGNPPKIATFQLGTKTIKTISTTEIFPLWPPIFFGKKSSSLEQGGVCFFSLCPQFKKT